MAIFRFFLLALAVWLILRAIRSLRPPRRPEVRKYEDLGRIEDAEYEDIDEDDAPHSSVSGE